MSVKFSFSLFQFSHEITTSFTWINVILPLDSNKHDKMMDDYWPTQDSMALEDDLRAFVDKMDDQEKNFEEVV